jgi:hypothetical protein
MSSTPISPFHLREGVAAGMENDPFGPIDDILLDDDQQNNDMNNVVHTINNNDVNNDHINKVSIVIHGISPLSVAMAPTAPVVAPSYVLSSAPPTEQHSQPLPSNHNSSNQLNAVVPSASVAASEPEPEMGSMSTKHQNDSSIPPALPASLGESLPLPRPPNEPTASPTPRVSISRNNNDNDGNGHVPQQQLDDRQPSGSYDQSQPQHQPQQQLEGVARTSVGHQSSGPQQQAAHTEMIDITPIELPIRRKHWWWRALFLAILLIPGGIFSTLSGVKGPWCQPRLIASSSPPTYEEDSDRCICGARDVMFSWSSALMGMGISMMLISFMLYGLGTAETVKHKKAQTNVHGNRPHGNNGPNDADDDVNRNACFERLLGCWAPPSPILVETDRANMITMVVG